MTAPYISVVVTTRNDNYGENMGQRLNMFVQGLDQHEQKYPGLFELVIVEWNPPIDRPPLNTIVPECKNLPIRVITVPTEYHQQTGVKKPMVEYLAKNAGIRRSQGDFVLVSNPDVLFSYNLVDYLAKKTLQHDVVYRCDRYDFDGTGINEIDATNHIDYAFSKIFRLHGMVNQNSLTLDIDMEQNPGSIPVSIYNKDTLHTNGAGDFMLMSKITAEKVGGLYQGNECDGHGDSASMLLFKKKGINQGLFRFPSMILHHDHDRDTQRPAWNPSNIIDAINEYVCDDWGLSEVDLNEWSNHAS